MGGQHRCDMCSALFQTQLNKDLHSRYCTRVMASSPRSDYSTDNQSMSDSEFRSHTPDANMQMPARLSSLGLAPIKIPLNF